MLDDITLFQFLQMVIPFIFVVLKTFEAIKNGELIFVKIGFYLLKFFKIISARLGCWWDYRYNDKSKSQRNTARPDKIFQFRWHYYSSDGNWPVV